MDIKANVNYALEGKFKVDIFSKEGKLIESTNWFDNFITPTGLSYVYKYKFADCFKFLSLGTNDGDCHNSGNASVGSIGTTGLCNKIDYFVTNLSSGSDPTITGREGIWYEGGQYTGTVNAQYIGNWGYKENHNSIIEDGYGPRYYRVWRVPSYDCYLTGYTDGLRIGEFMVSPSSGSDPSGNKAFSRVIKDILIPNETYAYVSYQLGISLSNTTIQVLTGGTFNTGNADTGNELAEVEQWGNLSGYYRQTYHGLAWMDTQGNTFVPAYGAIMEPSWTGMDNCRFYLSPDNGQFDVNPTGGSQLTETGAYAADGLLEFIHESMFESLDAVPAEKAPGLPSNGLLPKNIRYNSNSPTLYDYRTEKTNNLSTTKPYEYQEFSSATPGATGLYQDAAQFGNKVLVSTKGFNMPVSAIQTGRSRTLSRRHSFLPSQSMGKNTRFGAMVYAYKDKAAADAVYWPMIDCLFFDSTGQSVMAHYREITGVYFTHRGSGVLDAFTYTVPALDAPFTHRTFQGPGTGDLNSHPAILGNQ